MEKTLKLKPATGTDPGPAAENNLHRAMQTVPKPMRKEIEGQDCTRFSNSDWDSLKLAHGVVGNF